MKKKNKILMGILLLFFLIIILANLSLTVSAVTCTAGYFCPSGYTCFNGYYYCSSLESNAYFKQYTDSSCTKTSYKYYCGSGEYCKSGVGCVQETSCTDSDGIDYKTRGTVITDYRGTKTTYVDACGTTDPNTVFEKYCLNNWISTASKNCADYGSGWTCKDGACVAPSCEVGDFCPTGYSCNNYFILGWGTHPYYCGLGNKVYYSYKELRSGVCYTTAIVAKTCGADEVCENGKCVSPTNCTLSKCEDCGGGVLNLCDRAECEACKTKLGCEFTPQLIGGTCKISEEKKCKNCFDWLFSKFKSEEKKCFSATLIKAKWWNPTTWAIYFVGGEITQDTVCPIYLIFVGGILIIVLLIVILIIKMIKRR